MDRPLQVRRPIPNMRGEDWSDLVMLAHVGVEIAQEVGQGLATAEAFEKGGVHGWWRHQSSISGIEQAGLA